MLTRADMVRAIVKDDEYYFTKHSVLEIVHYIFDEHEAQMKTKDEEIAKLTYAHISELQRVGKKARSIVAMVFSGWREFRNSIREHEKMYPNKPIKLYADLILKDFELMYKKAYKILKDNK